MSSAKTPGQVETRGMVGAPREYRQVLSRRPENCRLSLELGCMGPCPLIQSIMQIASCQQEMLCLRSATVESLILPNMLEPCKIADVIWSDQQVPIMQMNVEKSLCKYIEYCLIKWCDIILCTDVGAVWAGWPPSAFQNGHIYLCGRVGRREVWFLHVHCTPGTCWPPVSELFSCARGYKLECSVASVERGLSIRKHMRIIKWFCLP
jgi:hypothetical protein